MGNKKTVVYQLTDPLNYTPQQYDFKSMKKSLETSNKALRNRYNNLEVLKLNTESADNLTSAISNYNRQLELVQINERLLEYMEKSISIEKDRYSNGFSSALNFRTVQLEYINAQFTRLQTIFELLKNEVEILRITGALE